MRNFSKTALSVSQLSAFSFTSAWSSSFPCRNESRAKNAWFFSRVKFMKSWDVVSLNSTRWRSVPLEIEAMRSRNLAAASKFRSLAMFIIRSWRWAGTSFVSPRRNFFICSTSAR